MWGGRESITWKVTLYDDDEHDVVDDDVDAVDVVDDEVDDEVDDREKEEDCGVIDQDY